MTTETAFRGIGWGLLAALLFTTTAVQSQTPGVADRLVRIGSIMDLEGDASSLGISMKTGLEAAMAGKRIQGRSIEMVFMNDFYDPPHATEAAAALIEQGVFAMVGNVGSPTSKAVIPLLAESGVPAIGFLTGAEHMGNIEGEILNFRPSYASESASVVRAALAAGIEPGQICAFAQNDAYGMSGVAGVREALIETDGTESLVTLYDQILAEQGDNPERNQIGPVGVYQRNTLGIRDAYRSLKNWEQQNGKPCRLVVAVGLSVTNGLFIAYADYKGEPWRFATLSPASGQALRDALVSREATGAKVIATQIVPPLESDLPIIDEARNALDDQLSDITLEGYIVGKLFLAIANAIDGDLNRENFMKSARSQPFDIGGLTLDFRRGRYGSDKVYLTQLTDNGFVGISMDQLQRFLQ